jgi:hypothetical protein
MNGKQSKHLNRLATQAWGAGVEHPITGSLRTIKTLKRMYKRAWNRGHLK